MLKLAGDRPLPADEVELIELGGHFGRRTGFVPVAVSKCSFDVPSIELVQRCTDALLQFEQYLRKREDTATFYEWANIQRKGLRFQLEIYWYDSEFFLDRKEAYLVGAHPLAFGRFGCRPSDFAVVHYRYGESHDVPMNGHSDT